MRSVSTRFFVLFGLLAVFISFIAFYQSYEASREHATELLSQQAAMALEFNLAIRTYADEKIRPAVVKFYGREEFKPAVMSTSYMSRNIFESVQKKFPNYIIRFSSDSPRNPLNAANPDELRMIEYFRENPEVERVSGRMQIDGKRYLAHFSPKWIKQGCLRCHGEPEDASAELREQYGSTASFHRKIGDVAGLDLVAVPLDSIDAVLAAEMRSHFVYLATVLFFLIGSVCFVFRYVVARRLTDMAKHFNDIAEDMESSRLVPLEIKGNDEISTVGIAFNKLLEQLRVSHAFLEHGVSRRTEELRNANEQLQLELTERNRAEEALKESQQRLADIINFLPDATFVIDKEGRVISWNRAMEEMTGIASSEMLGKDDYEYALPFYGERRPILIDLILEPEEETKGEYLRLERKGSFLVSENYITELAPEGMHLFATAAALRDSKGSVVGAIESLRDITETKKSEKEKERLQIELRQSHKMEAMGTLAGGIAHDFNNILAAIIGYTEMALADSPQFSPIKNYLQQVLKAGLRAKDLVQQILSFSRMKLHRERVPMEITPLIKEALKLLRATLPTTVEIRQKITALSSVVLADATEIHQVLLNLCTNAAQAMDEKGGVLEVCLSEALIQPDSVGIPEGIKPGNYVLLTVSDTGLGMDPSIMDRIFDPYFTTKEVGKGSGLGLAVVHGIVKDHKGCVSVCSKPGEGTTFSVYLPKTEGRPETPDLSGAPVTRGSERVLFVDDEQALADLGRQTLESLGYKVVSKTSSIEALQIFRENPEQFDLVITDYTMPRMTGTDLAREIMLIRPDIPVILCTGFTERITEEKAKEMRIRAFVLKPLGLRDMAEVIRRVLENWE